MPGYRDGVRTEARTYLDADAGAPLHPVAVQALAAATAEGWADPRRLHAEGRRARLLLDGARASLAADLGCRTEELHLTSHHTLALHTGLLAVARGRRRVGRGVVLSAVERSAVHAAARHVAAGEDEDVVAVGVDRAGRVDLDGWRTAVARPGVAVAALQHANGEVGTRQPLAPAHEAARAAGVPLLVDAGASAGHDDLGDAWDLLAADPRGWGAQPGLGVLAVRSRVRSAPVAPEDEDPWSPGGVSVPLAVAAAASLGAVLADRAAADARRRALVDRLRARIGAEVPDVDVVGDPVDRLPHVLTFSCLYVDGEALLLELDRRGFAVGSGSACTSGSLEPSHVLAAMGALTHGNVRLTLPRDTTTQEVDRFVDALVGAVAGVRELGGVAGL